MGKKVEEKIINYNYSNNYFKIINEAFGIIAQRKKLLKNTYSKKHTYIFYTISTIMKFIFIYLIFAWFLLDLQELNVISKAEEILNVLTSYIVAIFISLILFFIINYIKIFAFIIKQKKYKELTIKIDEKGIYDNSIDIGLEVIVKWDMIKKVITSKNSIVILTSDKKVSLFYPKNDEIIDAIKKYRD